MITKDRTFVKRKYDYTAKEFLEHISNNPHPNLPVIAEVTDDYYVMEYIEGKTLYDVIQEEVLSQEDAKKYILQLLDAVQQLHNFKIVHRDIKPENIIITEEGTLKLIDFDISRKIVTSKKRDTVFLGTAGYAAPEQYGFTQTDERSDIYSIGIVYNFMLTGKTPPEETVGGQLGKIIKKCTEIDSSDRYKNLTILRNDIKKEKFTSYKVLDYIPGFRSRNIFKMGIAIWFYVCFIYYLYEEINFGLDQDSLEFFLYCVVLAAAVIYCIIFYAIVLNYGGITDLIKFPVKKPWLKTTVLSLIWYGLGCLLLTVTQDGPETYFLGNPIVASILMPTYLIYSLIKNLISGML